MSNTTTNTAGLSTNLLRRLALMQHLGEDFFILNDKAYLGEEDAARESFEPVKDDYESFDDFCSNECDEVEELDIDDCYDVDYYVLTDEEADEKWEESLDSYIEECIQPEIDKIAENTGNLQYYISFDEEKWKRDARTDGRGHSLSSYDGCENEEIVGDTTFYIYRIN